MDLKACALCRPKHGKILSVADGTIKPPLHPFCRCSLQRLIAILAGTATVMGASGADWYIKILKKLPPSYITKAVAEQYGWKPGLVHLDKVALGKMIGGDEYFNREGKLPTAPGRKWYEADINYSGGKRNSERILYSNDGLIFVTYDHYVTYKEIIWEAIT